MNCKPGQMAWIEVPRTKQTAALGMDQINGHVVRTLYVLPQRPDLEPQWVVDPPQHCRVARDVRTPVASAAAGTTLRFEGIPDSYLRPFPDFPPEELTELQRELVS